MPLAHQCVSLFLQHVSVADWGGSSVSKFCQFTISLFSSVCEQANFAPSIELDASGTVEPKQ